MVTTAGTWAQFHFYRPGAEHVDLVGDFSGWAKGRVPMVRTESGYWVVALRLPPGVYRFRYCADGEWFCDFASFGIEQGPFGPNALLRIPPPGTSCPWQGACEQSDACLHEMA